MQWKMLLVLTATLLCCPVHASSLDSPWKPGVHYEITTSRKTGAVAQRDDLLEVFSYTCGGCYMLQPYLDSWLGNQPRSLKFHRVYVMWTAQNRAHARLYYTLQSLGRSDLDQEVFKAIHSQGMSLFAPNEHDTFELHRRFAEAHGIAADAFTSMYYSTTVNELMKNGEALLLQYRIEQSPTFVVNETYVTSIALVTYGNPSIDTVFKRFLSLTQYLLAIKDTRSAAR